MDTAEMKGIRFMADCYINRGKFQIVSYDKNNNRRVHAFDLTKERAEEWVIFFKGAKIEQGG